MKQIYLLILLIAVGAANVFAGDYRYIEPDQFKQWMEKGKDMYIVDIQVPAEFKQHHFKGALETDSYPVKSAADKQKLDAVLPKLAAKQNDLVIVCPRGGGGAKNTFDYLKEKGIDEKRMFILKNGMQGWPYKEMTLGSK